jgi:hypothetical protein
MSLKSENVKRLRHSPARRQARQIHRGQRDNVSGIPSEFRTREGNHGGPNTLPIRPHLLSSGECFRKLHGSGLQLVRFHRVVCRYMLFTNSKFTISDLGDAESFTLEGFEFELLDHQITDDILVYDLTYGEFSVLACTFWE